MISCGLLLYRTGESSGALEILIAHMGGPFWAGKRAAAWSIPKGLPEADETDLLAVAEREFEEEMGSPAPEGESIPLGSVRSGNKRIHAFARRGAFDLRTFRSNEFEMEWPKGSGEMRRFPEVDEADWVSTERARELLVTSQVVFVDRLIDELRARGESPTVRSAASSPEGRA